MTPTIAAEHYQILREILSAHLPPTSKIWVFGSRAGGHVKPFSDLDLAIDAGRPLTLTESAALRDAFSESDLPWKVDILDRQTAAPDFWDAIAPAAILL
jgi:type I restriction enzyme S subunit